MDPRQAVVTSDVPLFGGRRPTAAGVAQLVEQLIRNQQVVRSTGSPAQFSNKIKHFDSHGLPENAFGNTWVTRSTSLADLTLALTRRDPRLNLLLDPTHGIR